MFIIYREYVVLMAIIGFLILFAIALIFGTVTIPTQEEMILIISSACLFIMAWLYKRDKNILEEE